MKHLSNQTTEIIEVCLLAGKIMLESGAETYRVEDTMTRIALSYGIQDSHSFVTPTGIIFSVEGSESTKLIRIVDRSTNLDKVTMVNSISRRISNGEVTAKVALEMLKEVEKKSHSYSIYFQTIAASVVSGCFLIMFQGKWIDFLPAFIAGGIGYLFLIYIHRFIQIKFFSEFFASLTIGFISYIFIRTGFGAELDKIIIGSVMPLVPGLLITNAVRDLMAGHLMSGLAKGAEAFLTAFAIGSGVAIIISIYT